MIFTTPIKSIPMGFPPERFPLIWHIKPHNNNGDIQRYLTSSWSPPRHGSMSASGHHALIFAPLESISASETASRGRRGPTPQASERTTREALGWNWGRPPSRRCRPLPNCARRVSPRRATRRCGASRWSWKCLSAAPFPARRNSRMLAYNTGPSFRRCGSFQNDCDLCSKGKVLSECFALMLASESPKVAHNVKESPKKPTNFNVDSHVHHAFRANDEINDIILCRFCRCPTLQSLRYEGPKAF